MPGCELLAKLVNNLGRPTNRRIYTNRRRRDRFPADRRRLNLLRRFVFILAYAKKGGVDT